MIKTLMSLVLAIPVLLAATQARAFEPTAGEDVEIRAYCTGFAQARDVVDYHAKHGAQEGYMIFRGYRNTFICYEKIVVFTPEKEVYARDVRGGALTIWRGVMPGSGEEIYAFFMVREVGS